jgi:hypothetical protein
LLVSPVASAVSTERGHKGGCSQHWQGWEPASRLGVAKGNYEELAMSWLRDQKSQIVSVSCWTIARVECDSL